MGSQATNSLLKRVCFTQSRIKRWVITHNSAVSTKEIAVWQASILPTWVTMKIMAIKIAYYKISKPKWLPVISRCRSRMFTTSKMRLSSTKPLQINLSNVSWRIQLSWCALAKTSSMIRLNKYKLTRLGYWASWTRTNLLTCVGQLNGQHTKSGKLSKQKNLRTSQWSTYAKRLVSKTR